MRNPFPLERPGPFNRQIERGAAGSAQPLEQLVRRMRVDHADIAQGQVQLLIVLPAGVVDAFHQVDQRIADRGRGTDAGEKAVGHGMITPLARRIAGVSQGRCRPARLVGRNSVPDKAIRAQAALCAPLSRGFS